LKEAIIYNNIESAISLFISFIISTFVISTFAAYIEANPNADTDLSLRTASIALESFLGKTAKYIWAIGLLAAG